MVEREARHHDRERAIRKRQRQHVAGVPVDIGERQRGRMLARLVDHRGRDVDAGRAAADLRERRDHKPRPAGNIEHGIVGARAGEIDQQPERLLVAHRGGIRERRGLLRELVDDDVGMRGHWSAPASTPL